MTKPRLRVAMIAPPWLPIPPKGYGGVETMINALVPALANLGVEVELFTVGESTVKAHKTHWLYQTGQYAHVHKPSYDVVPVQTAHILAALDSIRRDGTFDIIHDHNNSVGPLALAFSSDDLPPAVHTIHNPPFTTPDQNPNIPDNLPMFRQLAKTAKRLYLIGISKAMNDAAPKELKGRLLPYVHNAVDVSHFRYNEKKDDYFITLARFSPEKGQHIAVRACVKHDYHLKMAGNVGDIASRRRLLMELANPLSRYRSLADFRYFSDQILPHVLENDKIEFVGEVAGETKLEFIANAKALLFPIQWDEPFGIAAIEALASGTPVVAFNRGAMPEIITHGVNGFLVNNFTEFQKYMRRVGEIDPVACRASVERHFSASVMAKRYLERYMTAIQRSQ